MDLDKLAKPFLKNLNPYKPGKPIEQVQREKGITTPLSKLASNENPYPPHEKIRSAMTEAIKEINRYPESGAPDLTDRVAVVLNVGTDEVFVGNGTNEIIDLLIRAFVKSDENCVFSAFSFVVYKIICKQCDVEGVEVADRDYRHDLDAMAKAVNDKTKIVFVCNPNNPTGTYNTAGEIDEFLSRIPEDVLVVFDQAYYEYVSASDYPDVYTLRRKRPSIISLRTFSKIYSLAGLRIGYAIADSKVVEILNKMRQPFNVNRMAQAAAQAALECRGEFGAYLEENKRECDRLRKEMLDLGFECPPSQTNFLFVRPAGAPDNICERLEDLGVIVRPCVQFGGPENSFRVNMGTPEENNRFLAGMKTILGSS
ncbi:MAG: histidinol-phosphate transaminase [Candidatus Latescibacterota bacterium]|nr:MAG: histidinol-phosphate transaminase [Candidatus Latescibacterota bacterium]